MAITINDLREQMKAALPAARAAYKHKSTKTYNMREFWMEVGDLIKFHEKLPPAAQPVPAIYKFYEAGRIYYHAKKHGLQSAMMLKLTSP
jgi:hypothetical protein